MIHRKSLITSYKHTDAQQVSEEQLPWKVKPPPHPLPRFYRWAWCDDVWYGVSLCSVRASSAGCIPSQLLGHPRSSCWGRDTARRALTLCKRYSAAAKTLPCCQCCSSHKSKTQHHAGCFEESWLHPGQTIIVPCPVVRSSRVIHLFPPNTCLTLHVWFRISLHVYFGFGTLITLLVVWMMNAANRVDLWSENLHTISMTLKRSCL